VAESGAKLADSLAQLDPLTDTADVTARVVPAAARGSAESLS
jgi:hypothetical protein